MNWVWHFVNCASVELTVRISLWVRVSIYIACIWWESCFCRTACLFLEHTWNIVYPVAYISPREQASVSNTGPRPAPRHCRTDSTSLSRSLSVLDALPSSTFPPGDMKKVTCMCFFCLKVSIIILTLWQWLLHGLCLLQI